MIAIIGSRARRLMAANSWLVYAFLYLPILVLVIYSFNGGNRVAVWQGVSTRWYGEMFRNEEAIEALTNSLIVAGISTVVSTVLGTAAALATSERR